MGTLVLVRHGESRWNLSKRFTGWVDVPLSENGVREAQRCAKHCQGYQYSLAYTSPLARSQSTLFIILSQQNRTAVVQHPEDFRYRYKDGHRGDIPVEVTQTLNERHYGLLQGLGKKSAERIYGKERVIGWRRGYHERPPKGESLCDTYNRVLPFFLKTIVPRLRRGHTILVVSHGNTLRSLIKYIDQISDEGIASVDLPAARPIVYAYNHGKYRHIEGDYTFNRPLR